MEQTGWERIKSRIAAWIPTHISPEIIMLFYSLSDRLSFIGRSVRNDHRARNEAFLESKESPLKNGYIDNQSEWGSVCFGKKDMAFSGCEIMAVYNVLYALGKGNGPRFIASLIEEFEKSGAALKGLIGCSPASIRRHLKKYGIESKIVRKEESISSDTDMAIVTVYNDKKDLYAQIHTVAVIREKEGFTVHNAFTKQKHYADIKQAIHDA